MTREATKHGEETVAGRTGVPARHLCDLEAVRLRDMMAAREVLPSELLESCIERIDAVNPEINAVVATDYDRARAAAEQADAALKSGASVPPLHGLPVLVKDLTDTKGLKTTYGSLCYSEHIPSEDAPVVRSLKEAGAIVLGKTNTPEFGAGANTFNKVYGATVNPFNHRLTCGGSSGGSAAALACGMAPLATGSDFGGSLRIPASFCSVVGFRPSPGFVPSLSHKLGFSPLWTDGPMARSVADTGICLEALVGYDKRDPLSTPYVHAFRNPISRDTGLADLRVGFSADLGFAEIDSQIERVFEERKALLRTAFGSASDLSLDLSEAVDVFRVLRAQDVHAGYAELEQAEGDRIGENIRANILDAEQFTLADTARAGVAHTRLYRDFQRLFDDIDVLICPATAISPFPVADNHATSINGVELESYYSWYAITWALSLMGCPSMSLPCGLDHKAMPFGIQIVAARYDDGLLLRVAQVLEELLATGGVGREIPRL